MNEPNRKKIGRFLIFVHKSNLEMTSMHLPTVTALVSGTHTLWSALIIQRGSWTLQHTTYLDLVAYISTILLKEGIQRFQ
jgi:hypothetical protein